MGQETETTTDTTKANPPETIAETTPAVISTAPISAEEEAKQAAVDARIKAENAAAAAANPTVEEAQAEASKLVESGEGEDTAPDGKPTVDIVDGPTDEEIAESSVLAQYMTNMNRAHISVREVAQEHFTLADIHSAGQLVAKGTKFRLGDRDVTLAHDAVINFDGAGDEKVFVGMCVISDNLGPNGRVLNGQYDTLGRPVEEETTE